MSTHQVTRSLFIEAPVNAVWKLVGDFGEQTTWLPGSGNFEWSGDPNTPGTERVLRSSPDVVVRERLNFRDDDAHRIGYSMLESPFALSDHEATLDVTSRAGGSTVTWSATFQADDDDAPDIETMMGSQTFETGLENLAEQLK